MDVYVECIYLINGTLIGISFLFESILLNVYWSYKTLIKMTLLCNVSLLTLYHSPNYWVFFYWIGVFYFLFHCQIFLYFPIFLIVYFSLLCFLNTLLPETFIYSFFLIAPMQYNIVMMILLSFLWALVLGQYVSHIQKQVNQHTSFYTLSFNDEKTSYQGFLDTGNHAYYQGYPLIFISSSLLIDLNIVGEMTISGLHETTIPIALISKMTIQHVEFQHVYAGIIDNLDYDCLLHTQLLGGKL